MPCRNSFGTSRHRILVRFFATAAQGSFNNYKKVFMDEQ